MTAATRQTRRFRPIHLVLSLLLALGGVIGVSAPASAATETIQGSVSAPGLVLSDVRVYLSQRLTGAGANPHGRLFTDFTAQNTTVDLFTGEFSFPGLANGDYMLLITAGDNWVQQIHDYTVDGVTDMGFDPYVLEPGVPVSGTVRDAVTGAGIPGVEVVAIGAIDDYEQWIGWDIDAGDRPITPSNGAYKIIVPLGDYYELYAQNVNDPDYIAQSWNHLLAGGCGCSSYDPVTISPTGTASPAGPYDFDLIDIDDALFFPITALQWDGATPYEDVDVILEKNVSGTWKLRMHGLTDSSGFVLLFGAGDGDYRLRYTLNGVAQAVTLAEDCSCGGITYPLEDGGRRTLLSGLTVAVSFYPVDLTFAKPAVPSSGGGTSTPPRKPRTSTSTFVLPTPTATPTPTPTPTSTSTPSPTPSETSEPGPTPTPTVDPAPTQSAFDLWWLWLLLLLIVAAIIFFIVRAIARR